MSARDYHDLLRAKRFIWSCFLFCFWLFVVLAPGYQGSFGPFTMFLAAVGWLFWPRNKAKKLARLARLDEDLREAVSEEIERPANEAYSAWRENYEKRPEDRHDEAAKEERPVNKEYMARQEKLEKRRENHRKGLTKKRIEPR